ncbi:serine/threonine-protein kinase STK11-like [Oppia nitens]|uniref:serine/threonine-protein kinase STK11-like n=1 Tax=Oppia nitens TaxID=1686743 RepID=UPI0023DB8FE2|nr:serine/threonine-protein kinase STK11-like [Oppia nitens]
MTEKDSNDSHKTTSDDKINDSLNNNNKINNNDSNTNNTNNSNDNNKSKNNSNNNSNNNNQLFSDLNDTNTHIVIDEETGVIFIDTDKQVKYKEYNGYIKGEVLGKGAYGKVREFVNKQTLVRCAAKIFKLEWISEIKRRRYKSNIDDCIDTEIDLCGKLCHKNVIKFFDVFKRNRKLYIFMEYCVGPLSDLLPSVDDSSNMPKFKPLPKWQSHQYFCQLIDGLKYLHSRGVYHRDIKDDNLLLDNSHVIKIVDFGVCCVVDPFAGDDMITGLEGTLCYMAPEVDSAVPYSGSKADIWSAGVVLYKMITGSIPLIDGIPEFPDSITEDKPLQQLFVDIFRTDFRQRITIRGLKNHPWICLKHPINDNTAAGNEPRVEIPPKTSGDIYRCLTLLERLRIRYEMNVTDIVANAKGPNVRSDRVRQRRRPSPDSQRRSVTPLRRLIRLGLWTTTTGTNEEVAEEMK